MKTTAGWLASFAVVAVAASSASAQYVFPHVPSPYFSPVMKKPLGVAPDARGPGTYFVAANGVMHGPYYYVYPPFPPYNGIRPWVIPYKVAGEQNYQFRTLPATQQLPRLQSGPQPTAPMSSFESFPTDNMGQGQGPAQSLYPYHPFVRSPRDFFMFRENMEAQAKTLRPNLAP